MAGGSPFELYNVAGLKIPRYQMAAGMIGIYVGTYLAVSTYNSYKAKPPVKFDSPEEQAFVEKYIAHTRTEEHKPALLRVPFSQN